MHIRDLLESRAAAHPDRTFLIFEDTETSYREFDSTVNRVANGLRQCGISTGDRVCVMLSNCPPVPLHLVCPDETGGHSGADQ